MNKLTIPVASALLGIVVGALPMYAFMESRIVARTKAVVRISNLETALVEREKRFGEQHTDLKGRVYLAEQDIDAVKLDMARLHAESH